MDAIPRECQGCGDGENLADGSAFAAFHEESPFDLIDQAPVQIRFTTNKESGAEGYSVPDESIK